MTITQVMADNFRGTTGAIRLPGNRVVLNGDNGRGKSTVMDAIRFARSGEIPGLPKLPGDIWANTATGQQMTTTVMGSGGWLISRSLTRVGGTTKASGNVNGRDRKPPEMEIALEGAGADFQLLDVAGFWGISSDNNRVSHLCQFYRGDKYSVAGINAELPDQFRVKMVAGRPQPDQFEFVVAREADVAKVKSSATALTKSTGSTIGNILKQIGEIQRPAGSLHEIEQEMNSLKATAKRINANLVGFGGAKERYATWQEEIKAVDDEVNRITTSLGGIPLTVEACSASAEIENLKRQNAPPNEIKIQTLQEILAGLEEHGCDICKMLVKRGIAAEKRKSGKVDRSAVWAKIQSLENEAKQSARLAELTTKRQTLQSDSRSQALDALDSDVAEAAEGIAARLDVLQVHRDSLVRIADLQASIEKLRLDLLKAEEILVDVKEAEATLKQIKKDLAQEVFRPVADAITKYLPGNGAAFVGFDANLKLLIGWSIEGRAVATPRASLSGGERAVFDAAFALALCDLSGNTKPAVLLIEAAELSATNLPKLCTALAAAPDHVQVIIASWAPLIGVAGFEVIDVCWGQEVAHAA